MAESTSQLQAKLLALTHGKVDIMLDENTFKNTTQILREMAGAWEEMTDIERSAALELMGGKRQANILASVIKNFDTVEDVIATSMDSSGSAIAENEKYLDSIQGKIDLFNNSLQTMWMNFIDSKTVKNIVSLGTALIKLVDVIGLIPTGVGLFAGWKFAAAELEKAFGKTNVSTKELKKNINDYINQQKVAGQTATATAQEVVVAEQQKTAAQTQATAAGVAEEAQDKKNIATDLAGAAADKVKAESQKEENQTQIDGVAAGKAEENQDKKNIATDLAGAGADVGAGLNVKDITKAGSSTVGVLGKIGTGIKAVGLALGKAAIVMLAVKAATWAIGKAWEALDKNVIHRAEHIKEEVKSLQDSYKSMKETLDSNLNTLTISGDTNVYKTLEDEFTELTKGVDKYGNNLSLTAEQYERYKSICEDIVGINPYLASGYDSATAAIGNQADALSHLIDLYKEQAKYEAQQFTSDENLAKVYENAKNEYQEVLGQKEDVSFNAEDAARTAQYIMDAISGTWNGTEETFASSALGINGVLDALGLTDIDTTDVVGFGSTLDALTYIIANHSDQFIEALNNASDGTTKAYDDYVLTLDGSKISAASIALQGAANNYQTNVDAASKKVETANDGLIYTLSQLFTASSEYDDLNDASKSFLANWLRNSDLFKVESNLSIAEMKDKINDMITNLSVSVDAQKILDNIFAIDASKVDYEKYKTQIRDLIDQFWMAIGGDSNQLGFKNKQDLAIQLGFNFTFDRSNGPGQTDEGSLVRDLSRVVGENITDVQKWIDSQPAATVQALMRIDWTAEAGLTYDEVLEKVRATIPSEAISVKTYSVLVSEVESYNDILSQTSEIVSDNTEVTQEYKDSLKALGISEEELGECFYENNPLIVKNSARLNNLVKATKKTTSQNIKLAKSQARLKYYELYKELSKLTNGRKIASGATLAQVNSLYKEMTALQKTIARYSILEQKLLGAANAYDEFEKAQELDAAIDYESKAEEMVGHLVDAFHTAKLGTESAQAAIKGLVPESVYADLDTLDEKMQAVYDYFTTDLSKYFYVKFNDDGSLESAEMLIDNVKKFVEDGISNDVFTGSWEEWDLNPRIKSLDQLAEQMNVTKEVAFAFLQAMETYDISWIGGDASTLMDKLLPTSAEVKAFGEQMKDAYRNVGLDEDIDLTQRVKVSREVMLDKGWDIGDDTYSTVNTISAYASEFGLLEEGQSDYAINLTPILPDGTVIEGGEDAFKDWIRDELAGGKTLDDLDIVLGVYADMDSAVQEAEKLHKIQEEYYAMVASHSLENDIYRTTQKQTELQYKLGTGQIAPDTIVGADGKTTAEEQLIQLNKEAEENARAARENAAAWTEAQKAYDDASDAVTDLQDQLEKSVDDKEIKELQKQLDAAEDTMWDTYTALVKLGEPTELTLTVAEEQVQKDLENIKAKMSDVELDIVSQINIDDLKKDSDGTWIVDIKAYSELDDTSRARVQEYLDYINEQHVIDALQGDGVTTTLDTLNEIKDILQKSYELMVTATIDETYVNTWWEEFSSAPWYKKIYMVAEKAFSNGWASGTVGVDGTAHARGTAHKNGSWGAPKTETALVGELGPELLVRDGRWTTIGDNGAEFRNIKKGDIIFNHKQTEDLLSNGYVTGRGKLHGNLAFASGTAYSVHPWTGGMNIDDDWKNIYPSMWDTATNGEYLKDDSDDSDDKDDSEQLVDFIEMKLEEIEAIIEKTTAKISNFLDDTTSINSKDELYDELVKAEKDKSETYLKAAQKYNVEAAAALSGVPQQYQEMARNGAIAIKEFIGEDQVEIAEAIEKYREFAAKADEAENGHLEAIAAISAHRVEQLEDIATDFENIVSISKSHSDLLQAEMDLIEESGNRLSESYYEELKIHSQKQLDDMQNERAALQKILDDSVSAGDVIIGSDDWYSMLETIYEVDQEIVDCKTSLEEFQNAINDLYWDNFDKLIAEIDAIDSELSNLFDLISDNDKIVDDMGNWTADGYTALGLLVQQMEVAQQKSKEYGDAISKLKKDYKDGLYSTDEYNEKLAELTDGQYDAIKSYEDAKDAIISLNKTRVDAVKDGIQKEIDARSELIEKKKEELSADKDARDFERSVEESNKSISDVERKIASLKGNTSSSAIAERRRLEEELRKLQQEREDLFYDESVENQQEALDKELENFQDAKNKEIEDLEEYLKNQEKVLQDSFAIVQENTQQIAGKLVEIAEDYGVTISDTVATPWIKGVSAIGTYEEQLNTSVSATTKNLEALKQQLKDLEIQADQTANSVINATHSSVVTANDGHQTSIKGYATGSKSIEYDQWALIDELGDELQITPDGSGRLAYIKKGTGILNNTLTERLMDLAMDPTSMIENSRPVIGTPGITTTNNTITVDASVGTLLHVEHLDGSNPAEVTKLVDKAWEKKMQTLNNSIKKFTR